MYWVTRDVCVETYHGYPVSVVADVHVDVDAIGWDRRVGPSSRAVLGCLRMTCRDAHVDKVHQHTLTHARLDMTDNHPSQ